MSGSGRLAAAAERWPRDGVPRNPRTWLMTTARNREIDGIRRDRTVAANVLRRLDRVDEARAAYERAPGAGPRGGGAALARAAPGGARTLSGEPSRRRATLERLVDEGRARRVDEQITVWKRP
jgi:DNA-directed RNA polymerase specialized sigma24 family protein